MSLSSAVLFVYLVEVLDAVLVVDRCAAFSLSVELLGDIETSDAERYDSIRSTS